MQLPTLFAATGIVVAALAGGLALADPAAAKATVEITSIRPGTQVRVGGTVTVVGVGGDDAGPPYLQVCLQERHARTGWSDVACTPPEADGNHQWSGRFTLHTRFAHRGSYQVRALQYSLARPGAARHSDSVSATVSIHVR